jgi:hypothetical protein
LNNSPADEAPRSPLGAAIDALTASYKQLLDATMALNVAEVPYAICGGFAVAAWCLYHEQDELNRSDPDRIVPPRPITLVNTRDVDVVVHRADLPRAVAAMSRAGFVYEQAAQVNLFVRRGHWPGDRRAGVRRGLAEGIHLLFAGEGGGAERFESPVPEQSTPFSDTFWDADYTFRVIDLEQLVLMKLNSVGPKRLKDLIHLVELWESGAITEAVVRQVALDRRWLEGDRMYRFHQRFRGVMAAASSSGLRRYAMRGEAIERHFYEVLAGAIGRSPEQLLASLMRYAPEEEEQ